jgi:pimeloyl-ACP methyl ester carboxylesterase
MKFKNAFFTRFKERGWRGLMMLALLFGLVWQAGFAMATPAAAAFSGTLKGALDGAEYLIEVPQNWNGTLLLYSHGLVQPGDPNPAMVTFFDPTSEAELLARGYALAGSAFSSTGLAVEQALHDQINLLNYFEKTVGHAKRVIAWGHSMGGLISAGLVEKFPGRFAGALPVCGVNAGSVAEFNLLLDGGFAFKSLLAPQSNLQLANITDVGGNMGAAQQIFVNAVQNPQGRARLALVAALTSTSDWLDPDSPKPDPKDFVTRFNNQLGYLQNFTLPTTLGAVRADMEHKAGGNPSSNVDVNYKKQLEKSPSRDLVEAFYQQAGLKLEDDLKTLNQATRIQADAQAVAYLNKNITPSGKINVPVLTLHTTGDGFASPSQEQNYRKVINKAGKGNLLRQVFTERAGHCTFTPAETLAALQTLINRIDTGKWGDTGSQALNQAAIKLGPKFNGITQDDGTFIPVAPAYTAFKPSPFLRPFKPYYYHY